MHRPEQTCQQCQRRGENVEQVQLSQTNFQTLCPICTDLEINKMMNDAAKAILATNIFQQKPA